MRAIFNSSTGISTWLFEDLSRSPKLPLRTFFTLLSPKNHTAAACPVSFPPRNIVHSRAFERSKFSTTRTFLLDKNRTILRGNPPPTPPLQWLSLRGKKYPFHLDATVRPRCLLCASLDVILWHSRAIKSIRFQFRWSTTRTTHNFRWKAFHWVVGRKKGHCLKPPSQVSQRSHGNREQEHPSNKKKLTGFKKGRQIELLAESPSPTRVDHLFFVVEPFWMTDRLRCCPIPRWKFDRKFSGRASFVFCLVVPRLPLRRGGKGAKCWQGF